MPIITIQFIKDVVANDEQKRELIVKMTDTFISVVGEVARPYVYTIIQETPQYEWGIGGKPMPDLAYLIGPEYRGMHSKSNEIMGGVVEQMKSAGGNGASANKDTAAERMWLGAEQVKK
ncbi:MAG TPA: tautomerase family protein [Candidatus Limnocylindrales bacterium]|jgi:4-oxalocrotonate tautomerase family enzyme